MKTITGIRTKFVPEGTTCYGSKFGDNNFWYPCEKNQGIFKCDAIVKPLNWISVRKDLTPVSVRRVYISGIELINNEEIVVWVPSESIQKW